MDEQRHKIWWALHRRVSKGETLSEAESRIYQAGRAELEAEEQAGMSVTAEALRPLQARLRELIARNQKLAGQEMALRQRATELEKQYLALTGDPLGIEVLWPTRNTNPSAALSGIAAAIAGWKNPRPALN
jgi:hypothetical protein